MINIPVMDYIERQRKQIEANLTKDELFLITVIQNHGPRGLYTELDLALDREDIERVHIMLDAIKMFHESVAALVDLPQGFRDELIKELNILKNLKNSQ